MSKGGKKRKLDEEDCECVSSPYPQPVLGDVYEAPVEFVDVYTAAITDKKQTSTILRDLCQIIPLTGLQHLKRVKAPDGTDKHLRIIVAPVSTLGGETTAEPVKTDELIRRCCGDNITGDDAILLPGLHEFCTVTSVPANPALTRAQYERGKPAWPVLFHEDKWISSALDGTLFPASDRLAIEKHMRHAVQLAQTGDPTEKCVGAVIVDPVTSSVVGAGRDRTSHHPLQHAVMVAIDSVARNQGGGAWISQEEITSPFKANKALAISVPKDEEISTRSSIPYLCTGYDLYVTSEPCVMCSMALVHSRIHRVFYSCPSATGALGSTYKIHAQSNLNHHFQVFKGVLKSECALLNSACDD